MSNFSESTKFGPSPASIPNDVTILGIGPNLYKLENKFICQLNNVSWYLNPSSAKIYGVNSKDNIIKEFWIGSPPEEPWLADYHLICKFATHLGFLKEFTTYQIA